MDPLKPTAAEVQEFRRLEEQIWQAWNARLVPADARQYYSSNQQMLYFDFSPMKFTGWDEYQKVATQAIGGSGHAVTKINDDFSLIKNGDLAVVAFTFHVDFYGKDGRKSGGADARETDVFVKENGRWVIAHQHMSFPSGGSMAAPAGATQ
ncbi:MAG: nuclear transport factor 2 family protein [Gammaproteobacteria bacterium]|nr:nuclear transport factor 2 family protein [Gammaproteobacteria bacterium]